ncbi:MAG: hypothetical protein ACSHW0_16325 [Thalassotalea sp.]
MRLILVFFIAIMVIALWGGEQNHRNRGFEQVSHEQYSDNILLAKARSAINNIPASYTSNKNQQGTVSFVSEDKKFSEADLHRYLAKQKRLGKPVPSNLVWRDKQRHDATSSTIGVDWQHHFVNSYLVGIRPFNVDNNWLPLYLIAKLKTYQFDQEQYGTVEMWQNSAQALLLPRGDCEDHALALADWLISEGVDAKVVIGTYKKGGHAWVVAQMNQQTYLLEATNKRVRKSWNHLPLAALSQHYSPTHMFNRTDFWFNTQPAITKDYVGGHWVKTSKFSKAL